MDSGFSTKTRGLFSWWTTFRRGSDYPPRIVALQALARTNESGKGNLARFQERIGSKGKSSGSPSRSPRFVISHFPLGSFSAWVPFSTFGASIKNGGRLPHRYHGRIFQDGEPSSFSICWMLPATFSIIQNLGFISSTSLLASLTSSIPFSGLGCSRCPLYAESFVKGENSVQGGPAITTSKDWLVWNFRMSL